MKVQRKTSESGGILVATIIFCVLVGLVLMAYLSMLSSQRRMAFRSQVWNQCIPMCEAGVEEAMAHMNFRGTPAPNFAINGWVLSNNAYRKQRALNGGVMEMAISNVSPPIITVRGFLRAPISSSNIVRTVRVQTKVNRMFPNAMLARGSITMGGNGTRIDSYNSTNTLESTSGQYDPLKATDDAIVTSLATNAGAISVGNVSVYGQVATAPGGTVTLNNNGNVGSTLWNSNPLNDGLIEPGAIRNDANVYISPPELPTGFAPMVPGPGTVNGTNYAYVLGDGDWRLPSINLSGPNILINGKARIHVTGGMNISGDSAILIANSGTVEWYQSGNVTLAGRGVINAPGLAKDFSLIGLPGCATVSYSGSSKFIGTIYAPGAAVSISGTADAFGAIVGSTIAVTGNMSFHYDQALTGNPRQGLYIASTWQEL